MEKAGLLIFCHTIHIYCNSPAEPGYALPWQTVYPDQLASEEAN